MFNMNGKIRFTSVRTKGGVVTYKALGENTNNRETWLQQKI